MKVLFLISMKDNSKISGGQYSLFKLANAMAQQNIEVCVAYSNFEKILNSPMIKIIPIPYFNSKSKIFSLLNLFIEKVYNYLVLYPLISKTKFDYVIGSQKKPAIDAVKISNKFNIKSALFIFETPIWLSNKLPGWEDIYNNSRSLQKSWFKFKESLHDANLIYANSITCSNELRKWTGLKSDEIIYPGVDLKMKNEFKKKLNQICYIGRLEKSKNVDLLIKAFNQIESKATLLICGTGSQDKSLKSLASKNKFNNIIFRGLVSEQEKWNILGQSSLMVFPSSFEGFGMPPLEAISVGTITLCSDLPIFKEVYNDSVIYFEENNLNHLVKKIKYCLENMDTENMRVNHSKTKIINKYSWKNSSNSLIKSLKDNAK